MTKNLKWKTVLVILVVGFAFWIGYPPLDVRNKEGDLIKEGKVNLGLDLQGGMYLVLEVDTSGLTEEEARDASDRAVTTIRNRIDNMGLKEPLINKVTGDRIVIQLPGETNREEAIKIVNQVAHLEFRLVSDNPELFKEAIAIKEAGEEEKSGEMRPEEAKEGQAEVGEAKVEETGLVGEEKEKEAQAEEAKKKELEGYELLTMKDRSNKEIIEYLVSKEVEMRGEHIASAEVDFDQQRFGTPYVKFTLDKEGAKIFADVTRENLEKQLAIVLDGTLISAPVIRSVIPGGEGRIEGNFSRDSARRLAIVLESGSLPCPVKIIEERTVGPTLGRDSIEKGIRATLIGGVAVLIFMALYYMIAGLIADFALILNLILIMGALAYFHGTLTLPGIAGLVLTIGMSVDANVLIFERIREESRLGKSIRAAIQSGFQRAFLTILDANLTTLITALILFQFGTGPVRGFATVLSIGIVSSMFAAIVITRLILDLFTTGERKINKLTMLQFIKDSKINFIGMRKGAYIVSIILIIIGMFAFMRKKEANYSIDFTGGVLQQYKFHTVVPLDNIRAALREIGSGNVPIQQFADKREVLIKTQEDNSNDIIAKFKESFKDNSFDVMRIEKVGPSIGKDLREKALKAVLFAMLGICIYISFRFEFRFAIAAIVALLHDVLISLGALALTNREISIPVIAALLTIVGYSINDTIVVFDRIREDRKLMRKATYPEIINTSINQTLSRTLLTSLTTLVVVLALYFFGGEVINDFAFVMLVGVIVGTYSSVFVASPILIDWPSKRVKVKR
ncbi:MAG: hypothetical protein A2Z72_08535 [Omnitrophica bacterium RBG_13_46_9]|nr:MAG: hypothetical protein A2Z72_08535 [Omnitrophica bacterium RBG_13_46_9]